MRQTEFQHALSLGLGRVILLLQQHPASPYHDLILHACLHNQAYDPQIEGTRTAYLLDILEVTGNEQVYRDHILAALAAFADEGVSGYQYWDRVQLIELTAAFAAEDDLAARQALYAAFERDVLDDTAAVCIIDLDELDGFLYVAERRGAYALTQSTFSPDDYLLVVINDEFGEDTVQPFLARATAENPRIAAYIQAVQASRDERETRINNRPSIANLSYDQLKPLLDHPELSLWSLGRWGRDASATDLVQAAHDLLAETEPERLYRYLWFFRLRAFPLDRARLVELAWSSYKPHARTALIALANITHPELRTLAFRLVEQRHMVRYGLELLKHNYQEGDYTFIESVLTAPLDVDDLHGAGLALLNIFEAHPTPDAIPSLMLLYERGPCANCRYHVVKHLIQLDAVPPGMAEECAYDAHLETRELVAG